MTVYVALIRLNFAQSHSLHGRLTAVLINKYLTVIISLSYVV